MLAARRGSVECVEVLSKVQGINLNTINNIGCSAVAAEIGHVIKFDDLGYTPLMLAAERGYAECVELLSNAPGIDVNIKNNGGNTALMLAMKGGRESSPMSAYLKCIKALINHPEAAISEDNEISQQYLEPEEVMMDDSESRLADEAKRAARKRSYERTRVDEK